MIRTFRFTRNRVAIALALILTAVVTTLANQSLFNDATAHPESDGATVRISALKSESGAVRVALQQQESGGAWGERLHPDLNTVRESAQTGVWLHSSPLQVADASAADGPLFCIAAHGTRDDYFWRLLRGFSRQAANDIGLSVRFTHSADGAAQAAEINRCSEDGAAVIASTLADPDAVRDALLAARTAGARILTFNSGSEADATSVGSEIHIGLDDAAAGRLAGSEFNRLGVTGNIGCLLHETQNAGLLTRCAELAATYQGGETIRVQLPAGGDSAAVQAAVEARLVDSEQPALVALLALNGDTMFAALKAILATAEQVEHTVKIGSIGGNNALATIPLAERVPHQLFIIDAATEIQGYLMTSALQMMYTSPRGSSFIARPTILSATPFVFDTKQIAGSPKERQATLERLLARLALGEEYFDD